MTTGRRRKVRVTPLISVSERALHVASRHAREGLPNEVGGIIIGWRESSSVIVHDLLLVEDATATTHHYDRNHDLAQQSLEERTAQPNERQLGYVGEWHSHPAPQPPSPTDLKALRDVARTLDHSIALLVLAAHRDGTSIEPLGTIAQRNRRGRLHLHTAHVSIH